MNKKFLQIGLGSMGKRRIRNLLANGIKKDQIFGFDLVAEKRKEAEEKYGIKVYDNFEKAVAEIKPDVYIISTPPDKHHQYFLAAASVKKHFFVEVTIVDTGYDKLYKLLDDSFVAAPSCTFRYFPAIKKIKEEVKRGTIGRILSFQYHLGQYLPDWHPWEDYKKVYYAQKETGGCREMFPYELIWLTDIIGAKVKKVGGVTAKVSDLEMTADDVYFAVLEFDNKVIGNIAIDLLARTPLRTLRLVGTEGVLDWEWLKYEIRIYQAKTKKWETLKLEKGKSEKGYVATEDMYQEEIKIFLEAIEGKVKYPYTFVENQQVLKTLQALEKGAKKNKFIEVK
jgi:predicted dehydrogenase